MSGYGANFAMVLDTEKVEALVAEPFAAFRETLEKYEVTFDVFAEGYAMGYECDIKEIINGKKIDTWTAQNEIETAFKAVTLAFKEKTGFSLVVEYHNQDEVGDDDDEVDGGFFSLLFDEVYQEREEATALKEVVPFNLRYYVNQG